MISAAIRWERRQLCVSELQPLVSPPAKSFVHNFFGNGDGPSKEQGEGVMSCRNLLGRSDRSDLDAISVPGIGDGEADRPAVPKV